MIKTGCESMKVEYQEADIDKVLQYFVDGLEVPEGKAIWKAEPFYDVRQGKVIFRLYILDDPESEKK